MVLCAVQALVHALTVKGCCHCWVTLSTREAGLQPDTRGLLGLLVQIPINLPTGISL